MSVGESVRILRELQKLSQNELADSSEIPQSTRTENHPAFFSSSRRIRLSVLASTGR